MPKTLFLGHTFCSTWNDWLILSAIWHQDKEDDTLPLNSHNRERSFSVLTESGTVCTEGTQGYMGKPYCIRSICVDSCSYGTNGDGKSMTDQILSLLPQNYQNYQNDKFYYSYVFCFVVDVHLLINKGIIHPKTLLL